MTEATLTQLEALLRPYENYLKLQWFKLIELKENLMGIQNLKAD